LKRIACLILIALAAHPAAARADEWREQSEKTVEARGLSSLAVENARGLIRIRPSSDGRIHLTALKIVRSNRRERAQNIARDIRVGLDQQGDRLVVKVHYPQNQQLRVGFWEMFSCFEWPKLEVRIGLDVPPAMAVTLNSTSGDLETEGMNGTQRLDTTSGNISVDGAGASIVASTTSGDISFAQVMSADLHSVSGDVEIDGMRGDLKAGTTSGDVMVKAVTGSATITSVSGEIQVLGSPRGLKARTVSGEIVARDAAGDVRLESASGSVTLAAAREMRRAEVNTASGDIVMSLAPSLGCEIEMHTSNGALDAALPIQVRNVSRHSMTGVIGNGATPVFLRSSSGDINVKSAGG
jgi:hypothetical protein